MEAWMSRGGSGGERWTRERNKWKCERSAKWGEDEVKVVNEARSFCWKRWGIWEHNEGVCVLKWQWWRSKWKCVATECSGSEEERPWRCEMWEMKELAVSDEMRYIALQLQRLLYPVSIRTLHRGRKCATDESRTITCRMKDRAEEGARVTGRALMQVQIMASCYHKK